MKKKLRLNDLKVQSFVTEQNGKNVNGGGSRIEATEFSCYDYISCGKVECYIHSNANECVLKSIVKNYC